MKAHATKHAGYSETDENETFASVWAMRSYERKYVELALVTGDNTRHSLNLSPDQAHSLASMLLQAANTAKHGLFEENDK